MILAVPTYCYRHVADMARDSSPGGDARCVASMLCAPQPRHPNGNGFDLFPPASRSFPHSLQRRQKYTISYKISNTRCALFLALNLRACSELKVAIA